MASYIVDHVYIPAGTSVVVHATGTSTSWTGATTWSLSGAPSGTSITSQAFVSATSFNITIQGGSVPGLFSMSDSTDSISQNLYVSSWQNLVTDNFNGAATSVGGAGTTTGVPTNWTDVFGSIYHLNGTNLTAIPAVGNGYQSYFLTRGANEDVSLNQQISIKWTASATVAGPSLSLRYTTSAGSPSHYSWVLPEVGGTGTNLRRYINNSGTNVSSPTATTAIVSGHQYQANFATIGTTTVSLIVEILDLTAGTRILEVISQDTPGVSQLQSQAQYAITCYGTTSFTIDQCITSYENVASINASPNFMLATSVGNSIAITGVNTAFASATFVLIQGTTTASVVTETINSTTSATLVLNAGGNLGSLIIQDNVSGASAYVPVQNSSLNITPNFVVAGSTGNSIALTESGVTFTPGTPGSPVFTASAGTLTAQTVTGTTTATLTFNAPSTGQIVIITDPSSGNTVALSVVAPLAITDTNIFYSPYGFFSDGTGSLQSNNIRASSTYVESINPGNYIIIPWQGSRMTFTVGEGSDTAEIGYSVDNGPLIEAALTGSTTVVAATQLVAGNHVTKIFYTAVAGPGTRWANPPTEFCKITAFAADGVTYSLAHNSLNCLIYWDSYGEGRNIGSATGITYVNDATLSSSRMMPDSLGCEYGNISFFGQGWQATGSATSLYTSGNDTNSSWNKYYPGAYRLYASGVPSSSGVLSPSPDYVLIPMGTNDGPGSPSVIQSTVSAFLPVLRTAAPNAKIMIMIPPNGTQGTAIAAGVTAYQASSGDANVFLINIGIQPGLAGTSFGPTLQSADGLHPRGNTHGEIAAKYMQAITAATTSGSGGSGNYRNGVLL